MLRRCGDDDVWRLMLSGQIRIGWADLPAENCLVGAFPTSSCIASSRSWETRVMRVTRAWNRVDDIDKEYRSIVNSKLTYSDFAMRVISYGRIE